MGIVREISPELDPVEFPDNMDEAAVDAFMAQRGRELRQGLIARRQAQLAAETEGEETLAYKEGKVSPWEYWGSVARELPQEGMRQAGQLLRGTGQYFASSPMPRERGEMGVVDLNRRLAQRTPQEIDRDVEGSMLRQLGTEIVADAPERFPTLPGVRDTLPSQVSAGLGSVAALLPAGLTGPAAPFVGGAMYGLSAGEDFADDAEQVINSRIAEALAQGNTSLAADLERRKFDMKNMARAAGRGVGTLTQAVFGVGSNIRLGKSQIGGIGKSIAERLVPKGAPEFVQNRVRGAAEGFVTEAAQEMSEQALGNAAAKAVYDPNRKLTEGVMQSGVVGGLTGKVVGGAFGSRRDPRDPLPASRAAAAAGEVVPGTEIPQDIGAPDLTLEDLGDLLPVEEVGTPVPATQETPENMGISQGTPVPEAAPEPAPETPAVDSPTLSPATVAETPVAPETPASLAPSSSVEGVTGEKPKRTSKAKRVAAVAPATVATVDPANDEQLGVNDRGEPVYWSNRAKTHYSIRDGRVQTAPWVEGLPDAAKQRLVELHTNASGAAPAPIPPDDTAMEAATAAVMTPAAPAPVAPAAAPAPQLTPEVSIPLGVKRPPVVDTALESLSDEEFNKLRRSKNKNLERLEKRYDAEDPTLNIAELAAAQDAFSSVELEQFRRNIQDRYAPDLFRDLMDMTDRARDPNSESAAESRIIIAEIQRQGVAIDELLSELDASSPDKAEILRGQFEDLKAVMGQRKPKQVQGSAIDVESREVTPIPPDDTAMEAATAAAMAPAAPAPVTTAPDEGIAERAAVDDEMTRATTRFPEVAPAQVGMPDEGIAPAQMAQPNPEPEAQSLTPKQYHKAINAWRAKEYGVPVSEVEENYSEESNKQDHWSAVNKFVERGGKLDSKILDSLDEDQIQYLQRSARASIPEGYLSPAVRAKNKAFEREMIDARKRGREEAKRVVPAPAAPAPKPKKVKAPTAKANRTFKALKAKAKPVGDGLYEIPKLTPAQRAALRDDRGRMIETDEFILRDKADVTGTPSDTGYILRDKAEAGARRAAATPDPTITEAPAAEPAAAQAAEISTPEVVKQSKPPMAPKAQKAYLLEKIDEAIATAPEGVAEKENKTDEEAWKKGGKKGSPADFALARNKARFGTVTIEVPGDGTFEILNTQQSLKAFKDKAKKFPTGKTGPSDASLPAKSQSRPATVGKSEKASFIESAKAFVSDGDKVVPTTRFIFSDKTKSVATDGKKLLVWDSPIGPEGFYTTEGKKTNESGRFLDYNAIISAPMNKVFKGLNTERLFNLVKQAMATVPDKRNAGTARSPKWVEQPRIVQIYRNQDGSIGVLAEGIDEAAYVHNVRKGSKLLTKLNGEQFLEIIQASRRMGSDKVDISFSSDDPQLGIVGVTWPDGAAYVMPMRGGLDSTLAESLTTGEKQPDILERALNAAISATDRKNATFSDPFLIAAVGLPVLNAALRIVRRVYLKTRDLARAKRQGMRLIRRQLRTDPKADLPRIEEAFNQLVEGTAEKPGPDQIEAFQAADGSRRQKSRGLFTGDVTVDTDAEWQAGAERWINQFNGNIRRAFEAARSTDYATTGLNPAAQDYVFGRLLELTEIQANAARNDVDALRALNLQKEIADAMRLASSEAGKALGARALVQNRLLWMFPVLNYRNLIREAQKRLPFPDVVADEVRTWLQESGRKAVQEMRNAMTDADKVFARELKTTVRDMRVVWRDVMTASVESQEAMRKKILEELVKAPELKGLSRQGYIDIANLLGKAWEKERARIFAAEFRKQVPLPSVKEDVRRKLFTAIPDILKWANLGLLDNEAFRNAVAPKFGVAKFDGETAKKLNTMAQRAQKVGGVNRNRIIAEMYDTMQREGGVRWPDIVRDYWYAAVLGAVNTQVDNALGVINGALNTVMGMAMSPPEVRKAMGKAYREGFSEAIADFFPILWRGDVARAINFNPEQPANTLNALSKSGNLFARGLSVGKYVSRLMTALDQINALSTDQAMKAYALGRRLPVEHVRRYMMPSENVLRTARLKAESEGTPPNLMRKRVREIVQESIPVEVLISSKDIRELVTFTNQPKGLMGALYRGVQEMEKKAPGFKMLSGTNFLRFAANYSNEILNYVAPVALYRYYVSAPSRADSQLGLKMGQEERQLILAKLAVGTALGTFAAALFLGDDDDEKDRKIDITGSFKSLDPNKRKQLLSEGRSPYSIRIGDKYVSYRQLPFGGVLGAIGELRDRQLYNPKEWNQESIARKFADGAFAGTLIVRDSPAISSFTEFLGTANAYKYDMNEQVEKSLPKYIARLGGSFIPRIAKEIDAWADPTIYKANTGHEFFLQQLPYGRRELGEGPVLNVLGEPVQVERYPWSRWVKTRKEDKAWSTLGELASKGVFLPVPAATVTVLDNGKRREMTPAESYRYQRRVGQAYRKFIEDNAERLLRMKPDDANEFIKNRTEQLRERLRNAKGA